jgi:hypothetical protein
MIVKFHVDYALGDIVYIKTDLEQLPRMVIAYEYSINGLLYKLACEIDLSIHYGIELTPDKNPLL